MAVPCPVPHREPPCELQQCTTDPPTAVGDCPAGCELGPCSPDDRAARAQELRGVTASEASSPRNHPCNCDELEYQQLERFSGRFPASFTKGLPHDAATGLVNEPAYCALLRALATGDPERFDQVPLGCCPTANPADAGCRPRRRLLDNPQAAFAYDLQGPDSHALCMLPAPALGSAEAMAEMAELYWMALARDIPFAHYAATPLIADAVADLQQYACFFYTPNQAEWLFRGIGVGDFSGPYVSQFLYMDAPYGATHIPARIHTLQPRIDYLTTYDEWLQVQNGCDRDQSNLDPTPRFIRNGRDLAQYVHVDLAFNAFVHAALVLAAARDPRRRGQARAGLGVEFSRCLPYVNPDTPWDEQFPGKAPNQAGFATFGQPHLLSLLLEAMNRALKAVWYQKWAVHRRLRPEELGHRVHSTLDGPTTFPLHAGNLAQLQATVLPRVRNHNGGQNGNRFRAPTADTYLLPQAYAEGCPIHPSYGGGHAAAAGAMATVLKAFFPEEAMILNPVVPTADGLGLVPVAPSGIAAVSVEGEINKLASNLALGRCFAGVNYRSDSTEGLLLGEELAIRLLCEQRNTFNEAFEIRFRRFNGDLVLIRPGQPPCPATPPRGPIDPRQCERTRTPYVCPPA